MKIAIDITQAIYGTGVSVYTKNLVSHLIKEFPNDQFVLFGGSLRRRQELSLLAKRLKGIPKIYSLPPRFMDFVWNSLHVYPVERIVGQVDLIHTSDWTEPPSSLPKVTTVHDLIPFKFPNSSHDLIRQAHKKRLSWVARESQAIIAVSQSTKKDLITLLKIPEEKITVIYEGVEDLYSPQPPSIINAIKRRYGIKNEYLFSLSTLEPRKNQQRLIQAFKIVNNTFPDLKLVLAGRTGWGEGIAPTNNVLMPGFVPDSDLPALYSGSLAYVLPSLYEGFSLSQLQAMACGVPVVTSNVSSMPEIVGKAGILVNPEDVNSIANGIIKAIKNRSDLIDKSINQAQKFSWTETARQTHDLYQKVLQQKTS